MISLKNKYVLPDSCGVVSNAKVYGLSDAVRRSKYPMAVDVSALTDDITPGIESLAKSSPGSGHDHWLCGVCVQFDLSFSVKAWTELERYHFINFVSSQSTMHRISKFDLSVPGAYSLYTDSRMIAIMQELVSAYNEKEESVKRYEKNCMELCVDKEAGGILKDLKRDAADAYLRILYSNPCGFRLTAGMTTNYLQLKTIYAQRKNHRLPEWREFCAWVETLPCSYLITGKDRDDTGF